jgi:hypothetical protein
MKKDLQKRILKVADLIKLAIKGPSETNMPKDINPDAVVLWKKILQSQNGEKHIYKSDDIKEQWRMADGLLKLFCKKEGIEPYVSKVVPPLPKEDERLITSIRNVQDILKNKGYTNRHKTYRYLNMLVDKLKEDGYVIEDGKVKEATNSYPKV